MRHVLLLAGMAVLLNAARCPLDPEPAGARKDWREARDRWTSSARTHYRFEYRRMCFCPAEVVRPVTIEVRRDTVIAVVDRETGTQMSLTQFGRPWPTVTELFAELDRAIRDADAVDARYDPASGIPLSARIDWMTNAADDETSFTTGGLTPLP